MTQHDMLNEILVLNAIEFLGRGRRDGQSAKWTNCERQIVRGARTCVKDPSSELEGLYRYAFSDSQFFFTKELAKFFNEPEWALMAVAAGIDITSDDFEYNFLLQPHSAGD